MTTYQYADGFDNPGALANVVVQPKSYGVSAADEVTGLTGVVHDEGTDGFRWIYTSIFGVDLATLFGQLGIAIAGAKSNRLTVNTLKDPLNSIWQNYNAIVIRPVIENRGRYALYRNVIFQFTDADEI